jgi:hypothetical protein
VPVTVPQIGNIRWRYCARWDEEPAANLGRSLLRLGICRPQDWTGSAVDFVERGFNRFCQANRIDDVRTVWQGDLRIMDHLFEVNERERNEARAEMDGPPRTLFLVGDYSAAASIPVGPTLPLLEGEHSLLPAAFHAAFIDCLQKWMLVYDHSDAAEHAEMGLIEMEEEEFKESVYPQVAATVPACLRDRLTMNPSRAFGLLREVQPKLRGSVARHLVAHLLDMHRNSTGYRHAWPGQLIGQVPGLEEYLEDSDGTGPGCLVNWYEDDAISACFDEEMTYIGQNGPLAPSILRMIALDIPQKAVDQSVRRLFDYVGAMLRSLASAAKIVEIIRDGYDEYLREHRLKSGLQTQPGASGVRDE